MNAEKKGTQEYLAKDRMKAGRAEFHGGRTRQVISGSHLHTLLATNLSGELRQRLKGGDCHVLNSTCDFW